MAAEIDHHHQAFFDGLFSAESQSQDNESEQSPSISELIDHGSISFGIYAAESIPWERRSAFSHNRCREELEKFRAPGLVAQKKAFFEEYYKKIRAMQADEISQPDLCGYAQSTSSTQSEIGINSMVSESEQENRHSNVIRIPIADNNVISDLNSSLGGTVDESDQATQEQQSDYDDKAGTKGISSIPFSRSIKKAPSSHTQSNSSSKTAQKYSQFSNTVHHNANLPNKRAHVLHTKGTVGSVGRETKLDCSITMKNAFKQTEKPNPALHRRTFRKSENSFLPSKKSDPNGASNINREISEAGASALNSLMARDKLVLSFPSIRTSQVKPNAASQGLAEKLPTKLPVQARPVKQVSSTSSTRAQQMKRSTASQGLPEKLPTTLPLHARSAKSVSSDHKMKPSATSQSTKLSVQTRSIKSILKEITITSDSRKMAQARRSANLSTQGKSNQNTGDEFGQKSYVKEGKQKEGKDNLNLKAVSSTRFGRDPKPVSSKILKAPNVKIPPWKSGDLHVFRSSQDSHRGNLSGDESTSARRKGNENMNRLLSACRRGNEKTMR